MSPCNAVTSNLGKGLRGRGLPYPNHLVLAALTPEMPILERAQSATESLAWISCALLSSPASYSCNTCTCNFGTTFARAEMTPLDPATNPGSRKSAFPAKGANSAAGRDDDKRCNLPTLPQVNFAPTIWGHDLAKSNIKSESRSILDVTPGKLYMIIGSGDWLAT